MIVSLKFATVLKRKAEKKSQWQRGEGRRTREKGNLLAFMLRAPSMS
jgi:hypothetical protein